MSELQLILEIDNSGMAARSPKYMLKIRLEVTINKVTKIMYEAKNLGD